MQSDDTAELYALESETKGLTSETKTFIVTIDEFTKKIDDEKTKNKAIYSPVFKIVSKKLSICVYPEQKIDNYTGIAVYLQNENKEEITASYTATLISVGDELAKKRSRNKKKVEIKPGSGRGWPCFVTTEEYKQWAEEHGDEFQVELKVKLHFTNSKNTWTEIW